MCTANVIGVKTDQGLGSWFSVRGIYMQLYICAACACALYVHVHHLMHVVCH